MDPVTLIKGKERREFPTRQAADIAIEHLGWSEIVVPQKPVELQAKVLITVPKKIEPPVRVAPPEIKEIKAQEIIQPQIKSVEVVSEGKSEAINVVPVGIPGTITQSSEKIQAPGTVVKKSTEKIQAPGTVVKKSTQGKR